MADVQYPEMRAEFAEFLKDISGGGHPSAGGVSDNIRDAYHFIFDDTAIAHHPEDLIGVIFRDARELEAAWPLIATLAVLRMDVGSTGGELIQKDPRWAKVQTYARELLSLLERP